MNRLKIVIDTNVYLSALLFGGNPRKVIERALLDGHTVVISEEIFTEMRKVISTKFPKFLVDYRAFEALLQNQALLVSLGEIAVQVCRDPKDNMIIETALTGRCDLIVTGDEDLLSIGAYQHVRIVNPVEGLSLLQ